MDVTVCIGTFGAPEWPKLAEDRAVPSVPDGVPVIHEHALTLAKARNAAVAKVETEWIVHLDADDELSPDYFDEMAKGTADLRGPSMLQILYGRPQPEPWIPRVWSHEHDCVGACLRQGNFLCIGTAARTEFIREVGGWEEFAWSEDWALWARCWKAGATVEQIPSAVYIAHRRPRSRNRPTRDTSLRWHREIERAVWPDEEPLA